MGDMTFVTWQGRLQLLCIVKVHRNSQKEPPLPMTALPSMRHESILEWLKQEHMLSVEELAHRLGVSIMTVHRDLNTLAEAGLVEKVHGGVRLRTTMPPLPQSTTPMCALCGMYVGSRTAFIVQPTDDDPVQTCCPHCGLLLVHQVKSFSTVLTRDFLYGHMLNAQQAIYLSEPDITLCCAPGVLAFAHMNDALRFQKGFGGTVLTFGEAIEHLLGLHRGDYGQK